MRIGNRYLALVAVAVTGILLAACGTTSSSSAGSTAVSPTAMPAATQNIVRGGDLAQDDDPGTKITPHLRRDCAR